MRKHRASLGRRFVIAALLAAGASRATLSVAAPRDSTLSRFGWVGTYDLVGSGFPDGDRWAVMTIARADTTYALASLQGPPGSLISFRVAGDSAHVVWNLGTEQMIVDMRGVGDSLVGQWSTSEWNGDIWGRRRR